MSEQKFKDTLNEDGWVKLHSIVSSSINSLIIETIEDLKKLI